MEEPVLLDFAVENYRSIKDEVVLSLMADKGNEHRSTNVVVSESIEGRKPIDAVRSAVIYGANGAGKTNILRALDVMRSMVLQSARGLDKLPVESFHFDQSSRDSPTTLEATIIGADGVRYRFGFRATQTTIVEEWLYAWPRGRLQTWYERQGDAFDFGQKLQGDREIWRRATRSDALFLSTAVGLNSEQLTPVHDWFKCRLRISMSGMWSRSFTLDCCEDARKDSIVRFLRAADIEISDLKVRREEPDESSFSHTFSDMVNRKFGEMRVDGLATVTLTHETDDGTKGDRDIEEESDGTQKLFALAGPWLDSLNNGSVLVIDELHDNLHPNLVRFLIDCFHNPQLNQKRAQLVFSTHGTSILSQNMLRRDQIWFCERDKTLATSLYALNEFRVRANVVNLERAYLNGRYGALPFLNSDELLIHTANE